MLPALRGAAGLRPPAASACPPPAKRVRDCARGQTAPRRRSQLSAGDRGQLLRQYGEACRLCGHGLRRNPGRQSLFLGRKSSPHPPPTQSRDRVAFPQLSSSRPGPRSKARRLEKSECPGSGACALGERFLPIPSQLCRRQAHVDNLKSAMVGAVTPWAATALRSQASVPRALDASAACSRVFLPCGLL